MCSNWASLASVVGFVRMKKGNKLRLANGYSCKDPTCSFLHDASCASSNSELEALSLLPYKDDHV